MKQQKIILLLVLVGIGLIMILTANVGYASVTNFRNDDIISLPERTIFRVKFYGRPAISGDGKAEVKFVGDTTARMNITGLNKAGDSVTVRFGIINTSPELEAELSKTVANSNKEYFKVTVTLSDNEISERNGQATISIKVELIKTPIDSIEKTNIYVKVIATPDD